MHPNAPGIASGLFRIDETIKKRVQHIPGYRKYLLEADVLRHKLQRAMDTEGKSEPETLQVCATEKETGKQSLWDVDKVLNTQNFSITTGMVIFKIRSTKTSRLIEQSLYWRLHACELPQRITIIMKL